MKTNNTTEARVKCYGDNEMNAKAHELREAGFNRVENAYWVEHWRKGDELVILERCDESERPATDNTPATMNANNIHVNNIVATLTDRNNIRKEIELPVIAAIREQAAKFDGKVFNRRFTAAVTKALQANPNRVNVGFRVKWDGTTEYDIINVHYNHNGNYGEFSIYPDRTNVQDYTDNDGRLIAERLVATCARYEAATLDNIASDENAINRTPEFVARVEAVQAEIEAINKDFPLSLRARFTGNVDFRR